SPFRMTGIAKAERKNTALPGGTVAALALISEAMVMNTQTEATLSAMPRSGAPTANAARSSTAGLLGPDAGGGLVCEGLEPATRGRLGVDDARHHGLGIGGV